MLNPASRSRSFPLASALALAGLGALLALGGCKKDDGPGALASGELSAPQQTTTPQRAFEPEEACVEACAAVSGSSADRFTALDDCMMDECYGDPPMDDPTVVACEAIGSGKISYGLAERDRCLARSCCDKARDCGGDLACATRLACVTRCKAR